MRFEDTQADPKYGKFNLQDMLSLVVGKTGRLCLEGDTSLGPMNIWDQSFISGHHAILEFQLKV